MLFTLNQPEIFRYFQKAGYEHVRIGGVHQSVCCVPVQSVVDHSHFSQSSLINSYILVPDHHQTKHKNRDTQSSLLH